MGVAGVGIIIMNLSDWLSRISSGRVAIGAMLFFLAFTALVLPLQADATDRALGEAPTPDTSFYYTTADLYEMADAYGPAGRALYIRARFTFDLLWPLVYTVFLATALSWLYTRISRPGSGWRQVNRLPILAALLDYLENISTSLVMARYPATTWGVDQIAPAFTVLKWITLTVSFLVLLGGMMLLGWRAIRRRRSA
jgi:hypothetical protein